MSLPEGHLGKSLERDAHNDQPIQEYKVVTQHEKMSWEKKKKKEKELQGQIVKATHYDDDDEEK